VSLRSHLINLTPGRIEPSWIIEGDPVRQPDLACYGAVAGLQPGIANYWRSRDIECIPTPTFSRRYYAPWSRFGGAAAAAVYSHSGDP